MLKRVADALFHFYVLGKQRAIMVTRKQQRFSWRKDAEHAAAGRVAVTDQGRVTWGRRRG